MTLIASISAATVYQAAAAVRAAASAAVCCCLLLSAAVCCCLLLSAAVCCCLLLRLLLRLLSAVYRICALYLRVVRCVCTVMGNFWSYVDSFQNIQPVTTLLVVGMIAIFVYQCWKKVSPEEFAFRYELVVDAGQYWRCMTATFSHLSIFHILMNMISLWLMSYMERSLHSIPYLKYSLILILGTQACQIAAGQQQQHREVRQPSAGGISRLSCACCRSCHC
jgi:Rhomboid family